MTVREVKEKPFLKMRHIAVSLHFLSSETGEESAFTSCQDFRSFEMDILSHIYQSSPPLASRRLKPMSVEIHFPESIIYETEGEKIISACGQRERKKKAMAYPSQTCFKDGIRIDHLTLIPAPSSYFTEYDLIKLVKLYGGSEEKLADANGNLDERVRLDAHIRFAVGLGDRTLDPDLDRPAENIQILRRCLFAGGASTAEARVAAGTIEICASDRIFHRTVSASSPGRRKMDFMTHIYDIVELIPQNKAEAIENIKKALRDKVQKELFSAFFSVIQGILNKRADPSEIADVFEPTVNQVQGLLRIHKATLFHLLKEDQVLDTVREAIGINPYLIIPHAVLLHNEFLLTRSEAIIGAAEKEKKTKIIAKSINKVSKSLQAQFLPNVFHYRTEKEIFSKGIDSRGISSKYEHCLKRLEALKTRLTTIHEEKDAKTSWRLEIILLLLAIIQVSGILFDVNKSGGLIVAISGLDAIAKGSLALFLLLAAYFFFKKK